MKISLVNPPNIEHSGTFRPPINLASLAAYVRQYDHEPKIVDIEAQGLDDPEEIAALLMQYGHELIAFTCLTPRYPIIVEIARACKRISKDVIILLGGPHVSGDPESVFYDSSIDYGIIGEGEGALLDLLNSLEKGTDVSEIPNLVFHNKDTIVVNSPRPFIKNLDELPFPAWDLLPLDLYNNDQLMFTSTYMGIISARGCAWDCNFCASRVIWKGKVRMRSAENLVEELKLLVKEYGISEFMFYDDTFSVNRKRTLKICELIKKEGLDIRFYVSLRADTINRKIAIALKSAGCVVVWLGVESGDEEILRETGKGVTKDQIRKTVANLKEVQIPIIASYIIGHPGDTHESIQATMEFAKELDTDQAKFFIAIPYPGTRIYKLATEKGLITKSNYLDLINYSTYQHVPVNLSFVSDEDLLAYQRKAYKYYDLRKRPIIRNQ